MPRTDVGKNLSYDLIKPLFGGFWGFKVRRSCALEWTSQSLLDTFYLEKIIFFKLRWRNTSRQVHTFNGRPNSFPLPTGAITSPIASIRSAASFEKAVAQHCKPGY
jgi:hypothetical protein